MKLGLVVSKRYAERPTRSRDEVVLAVVDFDKAGLSCPSKVDRWWVDCFLGYLQIAGSRVLFAIGLTFLSKILLQIPKATYFA